MARVLPRFTTAEMVFSLKTFAAAMLAMLLASLAGLPRPFWAMLTVYIVANPLAGAVRSKSLYRLIGTTLGSVAAVLLVPSLANAPELLTLALGGWTALCLFISLLDRTPRSYVFLLAGYTAAVIGFPTVQVPQRMFDTAVARVEEIGLAILCATAVHSLVFPTGMGPTILALLDRTLLHTRRWMLDLVAAGDHAPVATSDGPRAAASVRSALTEDRSRVAGDLTQLRLLSTHIPFDTTHLRWTAGAVGAMQDQVAALTPTLSAIEDRLQALLVAERSLRPDIVAALTSVKAWLETTGSDRVSDPENQARRGMAEPPVALLAGIRDLATAADAAAHAATHGDASDAWNRVLRISLAVRLEEFVDGWRACEALRSDVDAGLVGRPLQRRTTNLGGRVLHRDYGMAALSGLAALLAVCLCNAFWITTAWSSGAGAAVMAAVFCSFFATLDDPVPAIWRFLKFTLWSIPLSTLFVLVLIPAVHDFGMLVVVCAPVFLILGCYVGRPTTTGSAMPIVIGVTGTLALYDTASADLASFSNAITAQVIGMACAGLVTGLVRSIGADFSARRIRKAIWREIAGIAAAPGAIEPSQVFAVRMLDRIGLLSQRLPTGVDADTPAALGMAGLRDLRIGTDIARLQELRPALGQWSVGDVLADLVVLFDRRGAGRADGSRVERVPATLLTYLDRSLNATLNTVPDGSVRLAAITALVGLRRNLFPDAAPLRNAIGATT